MAARLLIRAVVRGAAAAAAVTPAAAAAPAARPAVAPAARQLALVRYAHVDAEGIGGEAFSFLMPKGWRFAGGIRWAADNGAKGINLSLGGSLPSRTLRDAVDWFWAHGYGRGPAAVAAGPVRA